LRRFSLTTLGGGAILPVVSRDNVEVVRRMYEEGPWRTEGTLDAIVGSLHPEAEYVNPAHAVEPGVRRGVDGFREALARLRESFDRYEHPIRELVDHGDLVLARVTFRSYGRGSGIPFERPESHVWTFREGKVFRHEWFDDDAAAMEVAGISR
jgi:ketosteroid isomerase-like protein